MAFLVLCLVLAGPAVAAPDIAVSPAQGPSPAAVAPSPAATPGPAAAPTDPTPPAPAPAPVDFQRLAARLPSFKTLVRLTFQPSLDLDRLVRLHQLGVLPLQGDLSRVLGRREGVFFTRAANLPALMNSGLARTAHPLRQFVMSGLYRIHFKLRQPDYQGPLAFKVSTPRDDFGKRIIQQEDSVFPRLPARISRDGAGNRWLEVEMPQAGPDSEIKFDFLVKYQVDLDRMLAHYLALAEPDPAAPLPPGSPQAAFLLPSAKISWQDPRVAGLASQLGPPGLAPRRLYGAMLAYIKKNLPYDHAKRAQFFGGRMVYEDMAQMYQTPAQTLERGVGACPDTCLLEAALFRARGLPARTAGRWGHFYSEVYVPGRGWMSTSVTPTAIPLVKDQDQNHLPLVSWTPAVKVQTTLWQGKVWIDPEATQ